MEDGGASSYGDSPRYGYRGGAPSPAPPALTAAQVWVYREHAREMLSHALGGYLAHAWPAD